MGSIVVTLATDAPLLPHRCEQVARRAGIGLARVGGGTEYSSGDIFIAFSVGNHGIPPADYGKAIEPVISVRSITNQVYYPNANAAARAFVKPAILDNEAVYPRGEKMKSLTLSLPLPTEILRLQNRLWTQLKAGR